MEYFYESNDKKKVVVMFVSIIIGEANVFNLFEFHAIEIVS